MKLLGGRFNLQYFELQICVIGDPAYNCGELWTCCSGVIYRTDERDFADTQKNPGMNQKSYREVCPCMAFVL